MADFLEDFLDDDPDRRGNDRVPFEETFEITSDQLEQPIFVIGDDISPGGIKFIGRSSLIEKILSDEAFQLLNEEEQLTEGGPVTIILNSSLQLNSEIRWISPVNPNKGEWDIETNQPIPKEKREGYQICVEFAELNEEQKAELNQYIKQLQKDESLES
ncbi:MAG: PilZ domain-containing protein [SAR324 cluster bacterium]|nr:PilZ domain-containing protein [SAR324 cluster bacterium]